MPARFRRRGHVDFRLGLRRFGLRFRRGCLFLDGGFLDLFLREVRHFRDFGDQLQRHDLAGRELADGLREIEQTRQDKAGMHEQRRENYESCAHTPPVNCLLCRASDCPC